jgi:hypothetical protein
MKKDNRERACCAKSCVGDRQTVGRYDAKCCNIGERGIHRSEEWRHNVGLAAERASVECACVHDQFAPLAARHHRQTCGRDVDAKATSAQHHNNRARHVGRQRHVVWRRRRARCESDMCRPTAPRCRLGTGAPGQCSRFLRSADTWATVDMSCTAGSRDKSPSPARCTCRSRQKRCWVARDT